MNNYVDVKVTERTQDKLYDDTFELLKDYAEDRWVENTYVLSFDDKVPTSLMKKLTNLTNSYPHDTVILSGNTVTFLNLGGHSNSSIAFELNITRRTWKQIARTFMRSLEGKHENSEAYLRAIYTIYVLSGKSASLCDAYWTPAIISTYVPDEVLAVV